MIITSAARTTELGDDLDKPFVAQFNFLTRASVTITSDSAVLTDGALVNAISGTTYDYWMPVVSGVITTYSAEFTFSTPIVTFAAIVGHNLGTLGGSVALERSPDGITWTDAGCGTHTPADDGPIGFRCEEGITGKAFWRFNFTGLAASDPLYVAELYMGEERVFPVGIYDGFAPPIYPTEVQLQSSVSVGGNLLGSSVISQGTVLSARFDYLDPDFVRSFMVGDFIQNFNAGQCVWFAWRPDTFPEDLRYCWREGPAIVPINSGGLDHMSIQMQMRAYEG